MQSPGGHQYDIPPTKGEREAFAQQRGRLDNEGRERDDKHQLTEKNMKKMYNGTNKSSAGWPVLDNDDQPIQDGRTRAKKKLYEEKDPEGKRPERQGSEAEASSSQTQDSPFA